MKRYILIALTLGFLVGCDQEKTYVENPEEYVSTLVGSLSDLVSGSGDKGTPIVLITGYFDNYATE